MNFRKSIIISAPSGAGKSTLAKYIMAQNSQLVFSVSACSREPREGEVNGKDYYFLGQGGFEDAIKKDAFVEWEEVFPDHFYGTLKVELERLWADGKTIIFDVDVVGGLRLKGQFGDSALAIFIQPPNVNALKERLIARGTDTLDKIDVRLEKATYEMTQAHLFDQIIVNNDLNEAQADIQTVVSTFLESE